MTRRLLPLAALGALAVATLAGCGKPSEEPALSGDPVEDEETTTTTVAPTSTTVVAGGGATTSTSTTAAR